MNGFNEESGHIFDYFHRNQVKINLGDFSAKVKFENIFKPTTEKKSLHKLITIMRRAQ
jgi:hypothetical protein